MPTYIEYNVLKQLNDDFLKNIEIIFIFGDKVSEVLIVTKDGTVFGFGQNDFGVLGFGHNRQVFEPKIVEELSGKGIISFVNGYSHVIGLTNDGKIYSWGENNLSQLGNGMRNNDFNKPEINKYLINEVIIEISCGGYHSIVLTEKNELYVWGYNNFGQIGNDSEEQFQLTPFKLKAFNGIIFVAISCGYWHSLVLTDKGHVFSWGSNEFGQLGFEENDGTYNMFKPKALKINKPIKVKVKNDNKSDVFIEKICCGCYQSMLLSSDRTIITFGNNGFGQISNKSVVDQTTPQKTNSPIKYKDIASNFRYNISIGVSVNDVFYIWGKLGENVIKSPEESELKSFNDIFLTYYQITHKSNKISCDFEKIINSSLDYKKNVIERRKTIIEIIRKKFLKFLKKRKKLSMKDYLNHFSLLFSPNIIAKYRKQTQIKANFDENMKISFNFFDRGNEFPYIGIGRNALFVSEESKVYAIGSNSNGLIGLNHKNAINKMMIVNELCDKGIIDFSNGYQHVVARTDKNQIYIWGYNNVGQLGNETNDNCFVPQLVEKLSDKCIVDVCCGTFHSLALTEGGEVYTWGWNKFRQIGNERDNECQLTPFKIQQFDDQKIISISCGAYHSLALTESGRVYSWGYNRFGELGFTKIICSNKPKRIKIINNKSVNVKIKQISCGFDYSLLLTSDGDIYGFGSNSFGQLANKCFENNFIPTKILIKNKFIEIASHYDCSLSAALSIDGIYYIWGDCIQIITEPKATRFDSFNNIFRKYFKITYNKSRTDIKYGTDFLISNQQNIIYKRHFQELCIISSGMFGIVSKVKNKNENEICAIKRIALNVELKDSVLKEFEIMSQLNCEFVVKVKNYWIEYNYLLKDDYIYHAFIKDPRNNLLLHIQMELCYKSLKEIIEIIKNELNFKYEELMTQIHYYISSELLIEIVECVDYLHKQNPPIIHRDLKPQNILITHGINGRFVKLCDFGLAKLQENDEQSHTKDVGTLKYMAPEVDNSLHSNLQYNTKADVYSLAIVIKDLFEDFKIQIEPKPEMIREKYKNLLALVVLMMKDQELRPNCESILNQKNSWALSISDIEKDTLLEEITNNSFIIQDNFHAFFIKKKLEILKQLQSDSSLTHYNGSRKIEDDSRQTGYPDSFPNSSAAETQIKTQSSEKNHLFNSFSEKLNKIFENNIKLSYVSSKSVIILTVDDKCYEFRRDYFINIIKNALIALSDDKSKVNSLIEESLVEELSYKNVIDFKNGFEHSIARTSDGKVYSWGENKWGVLGNETEDWQRYKPVMNAFLMKEEITEICCGAYHTLVLTTNGEVYAWGWNCHGQIGNNMSGFREFQSKPFNLNTFICEKVKAISCGYFHSLALTENDRVYSWGTNACGELGIGTKSYSCLPILIDFQEQLNFDKISCGLSHSSLLSREGDIYMCGLNRNFKLSSKDHEIVSTPIKLNHSEKFIDIASHYDHQFFAAVSVNSIHHIWGECVGKVFIHKLNSFNDIFEYYFGITYEKIVGKVIRFKDDFIQNNKYENKFIENKLIGTGSYGKVFEVCENKDPNNKYAIKKKKYECEYEADFMKELETSTVIYELSHKNIAKYFDVWLENDFIYENEIKHYSRNFILYIQMELCDITLDQFFDEMRKDSTFLLNGKLTTLGYFISSEIFIEILEGVNYLHTQNPQIIHRDLNPYNLMLKTDKLSNSFVKIADLGLATIHKYKNQSHTQDRGNQKYLAPEAKFGTQYDTRADIFSLGIVLQKLFFIDLNRDYEKQEKIQSKSFLIDKFLEINSLCDRMSRRDPHERPANIEEMLEEKDLWTLNKNEFSAKKELEKVLTELMVKSNVNNKSFIFKLLENKLSFIDYSHDSINSEKVRNELKKSELKSFKEIFENYFRTKYTPVEGKVDRFEENLIQNGKYENVFICKKRLGGGSYGEVFEVKKKYKKEKYAIKIVKFTYEKEFLKEMENFPTISELRHEKVVQYFEVWLENEKDFKIGVQKYITYFKLYIQMELCDRNLDDIINEIKSDSNLYSNETLTSLGYYIASEIFIEILEGVKYLHDEQKEPIYHRDLNPWNIMLKMVKDSNSWVKIVDFGLATIHKYANQLHTADRGHPEYIADEVRDSTEYDHRADIYSLGKVSHKLFFINLKSKYEIKNKSEALLMQKYQQIQSLCNRMTQMAVFLRPESIKEILEEKNLWALNANQFGAKKVFEESNINQNLYAYKLLNRRLTNS